MSPEAVKFFPDILEEFFEELDFLWMQRESVIFAPDWTLAELGELEERAEAHLDGLRLSGDDGIALARPHLRGEERGAATAATFVLMEAGRPDLDAEVVAALVAAEPPAKAGIGIGLRHVDVAPIAGELRRLATDADALVRSIAVDVLAFHRLGPPPQKMLQLFSVKDPEIRARAYTAAGRFGGPWGPDEVQSALDQPHAGLRWAAIHASARLALPGLADYLRRAAQRVEVPAPEAIEFLGVLGDPKDLSLFRGLIQRPALRGAALAAMGASGRVEAVPWILEAMQDPASVLAAGEAFVRITAAQRIEADAPLPPPAGLSEEEADFAPTVTPPDPAKAAAWWKREASRFPAECAWLDGLRAETTTVFGPLSPASLRTRRDVALRETVNGRTVAGELERRARLQISLHDLRGGSHG